MSGTIDHIKARRKLRVGIAADVPGKSFLNPKTNRYEGFETDLARMIAKEMFGDENTVEFVKVLGPERVNSLKEDRVDLVISLFTITHERLREVDFSKPYMIDKEVLITLKNGPTKRLADIKGKKVAIVENSATLLSFRENFPEAEIVSVKNKTEGMQAIRDKKVAAMANTFVNLSLMKPTLPDADQFALIDTGNQFTPKEYAVGVKKGRSDLVNYINKCIDKFEADGSLKKLLIKHGWRT